MVGITVCALFFLLANLGHGSVVIDDPVQVAYINTMQDMFKDQLRAMSSMMLNMGSVFADVKFNNLMRSGDYETPQVPSSPFSLQIFSDHSREGRSPQEQTTYRSYLRGPSLFFFHDRKDTEPPCSKPFQTNYLRSVKINKPTETQHQDQSSSFSDTSSDSASESSYSSSSSTEESSFSTSDNYEYSYSGLLDDDDFMFMDDSADDNDNNKDDSIYYISSSAPATIPTSGQGSSEEVVLIDKNASEDQVSAVDSSRDSGDNIADSSEDSADMGMEERMRKPDEFYTAGSAAVISSPEQEPSAPATTDAATDSAVPFDVTTGSELDNMVNSADSVDSTTTTDAATVDAEQRQDNIGNINSNNNNDKYEDHKPASIATEQQNSEPMTLAQQAAAEPQEPLALSTTAGEIDSTDQSVLSDPPLTALTDLYAIHQDMENRSKPELRE